jgi:predicted nuclease of restriction endonuclease-like (RecB) superfamily
MAKPTLNTKFYSQIVELLQAARKNVVRAVNQTMVLTYFEIGRMIVEEEQYGLARAEYGKQIIKELSKVLNSEFRKGFSIRNIEQMRQFYLIYSKSQTLTDQFKKSLETSLSDTSNQNSSTLFKDFELAKAQTLSAVFHLSWSHYLILMRIEDEDERKFYEIEAHKNNWSVRELQRQSDSELYSRLVLSRDKSKVKELSEKGLVVEQPKDVVKDPYVLEFLGLPELSSYSETELEERIISKLEHFLLELGNGFTFVGRQVRFTFDEEHFRVDLVFYNRILKCFVLIDLKIGKLKHQDLGQMQMYVNYYDRFVKLDDENNTIGIILCKDKKDTIVEITLPENNKQIFASKYKLVLPSKAELKKIIE